MSIPRVLAALLVTSASSATAPALAQADSQPYSVEVWATVLFGTDGKPLEHALVDESKYPPKFAENVRARVAKAKIQPPEQEGKPTTLRTGVRLDFVVTPTSEGGQVRIAGLSMGALPLKRYYASYPKDIAQTGGWEGEVEGVCTIGIDGKCRLIDIKSLPGMPESVRRYAKASLEGWVFAPQEVGGKPIEGEFTLRLKLNTLDSAPEDFRQDKFQRLINSKQ